MNQNQNLQLVRMSAVVGHRGAAHHAPENTLGGLTAASKAGAQWVELDVRLNADGDLIIFHDDNLLRMAGVNARVIDTTGAELAQLDVGGGFDPGFEGERIPTLAETWQRAQELGLGVNLEIKATRHAFGVDADEARRVGTGLAQFIGDAEMLNGGLLVSSFSEVALDAFAQAGLGVAMALNLDPLPADWRSKAQKLGVGAIHLNDRHIDPEIAARVVAAGLVVGVFTVNNVDRARQLWDWGVTSVFSDDPQKLLEKQ